MENTNVGTTSSET